MSLKGCSSLAARTGSAKAVAPANWQKVRRFMAGVTVGQGASLPRKKGHPAVVLPEGVAPVEWLEMFSHPAKLAFSAKVTNLE